MKNQVIRIEVEPTREDANRIINERRERVRYYVREKLVEYQMPQPACDMGFGLWNINDENPYRYLINQSAIIHNAMVEAWGFFFEAERLRRELAELKGRIAEAGQCEIVE